MEEHTCTRSMPRAARQRYAAAAAQRARFRQRALLFLRGALRARALWLQVVVARVRCAVGKAVRAYVRRARQRVAIGCWQNGIVKNAGKRHAPRHEGQQAGAYVAVTSRPYA